MRASHAHVVCLTGLVVALSSLMTGCSSTSGSATKNYKKAAKTTDSMEATRAEALKARQQVARTLGALDKLVKSTDGDLGPQFEQYAKDVKAVESHARKVRSRADRMRKRGADYFASWAMELGTIANPDLRNSSAERRAESLGSYTEIEKAMQVAKAKFDPFMADLKDIENYLAQDLTAAGLKAVRGTVQKAKADGAHLQKGVNAVIVEIDRVKKEMSATPSP